MLAAAYPALNRKGEGSSPSDPTDTQALVVQWRGYRTRNAATRVRVPPGALRSLTIRPMIRRAHDVAAAYRLAMAEARVQLPLGAFDMQDVGKPGIPRASGARDRRFKSGRPDYRCGGTRAGTGRRLLIAPTQVRFLPPQPLRKGKPMGDGSRLESGRAMSLEGSTPSPSALQRALGRLAEASAFQAEQAGSIPAGRFRQRDRGSANGRPSGFEPGDGGSTPPPRTCHDRAVSRSATDAESSNGRMRRSERRHVGSSPASAVFDTRQRKSSGRMWSLS